MTKWTDLFPGRALLKRTVYDYQAGAYAIIAPANAILIRGSMVGGGSHGAGAAFARVKAVCTPGEAFTLAIGVANSAAGGNTVLTRNAGSVIICRADGAEAAVAGTVAGSIGDTKRAGSLGTFYPSTSIYIQSGDSGGDDPDPYPLGYGGPGAYMPGQDQGNSFRAAYPGAGGIYDGRLVAAGVTFPHWYIPAGHGRATIEFFAADPGYA